MKESEVRQLFLVIQNAYNGFVYDDVKVQIWQDLLRDTPFSLAQRNLRAHILNPDEKFPPTPGQLARRLETLAQGRYIPNAEETRLLLAERDRDWSNAVPMPEHLRGRFKLVPRTERTTS